MVEQGEILKVEGIKFQVIVVSNQHMNQSNLVTVCPIMKLDNRTTLSIPLEEDMYAICDTIKQLDLDARRFSIKGRVPLFRLIQIIDMIQSMFDYY